MTGRKPGSFAGKNRRRLEHKVTKVTKDRMTSGAACRVFPSGWIAGSARQRDAGTVIHGLRQSRLDLTAKDAKDGKRNSERAKDRTGLALMTNWRLSEQDHLDLLLGLRKPVTRLQIVRLSFLYSYLCVLCGEEQEHL